MDLQEAKNLLSGYGAAVVTSRISEDTLTKKKSLGQVLSFAAIQVQIKPIHRREQTAILCCIIIKYGTRKNYQNHIEPI